MSLNLYLLRHGETAYSQSGNFCGELDPDLTPAGHIMARHFGNAYRHLEWQGIYTSPKQRTISTARALSNAVGVEMTLREGLTEIRYGQWEDRTAEDVKTNDSEAYQHWMTEPAWNAPTGGETAVQIASRAMLVITEIEQTHPDGNVLVVSHKATLRVILCSLLGIDLGRYRDRLDMPAASVSVVKFGKYGPMLMSMGDRSYLPLEMRSRPGT
jgi:broad specificity phosphatase PhoE